MKVLIVVVLLAAACAEKPLRVYSVEDTTAFDYHARVGIPEAELIREQEEQMTADPSRVVGGESAVLGQVPYHGGLVITMNSGVTSVCGGSVLSNNRALTAAHCWNDGRNQARSFEVVLGSLLLFTGGIRIATSDVTMHPIWDPQTITNDIAVIRFAHVAFSSIIQPIALPSGQHLNNDFVGDICRFAGYGRQSGQITIPQSQSKAFGEQPGISNAVCQQTYGASVGPSTMCISTSGGISTCGGDSGGPLTTLIVNERGDTERILVGVTSFGHILGCSWGFPAGFCRVTAVIDFIRQHM